MYFFQLQHFRFTYVYLAGIYLLRVNNKNTRTRREICSKLTIKTPERRQGSCAPVVNFEHAIAGWDPRESSNFPI